MAVVQGGNPIRINVYAEELTEETEIVTKHVDDEKFGPRTFYGIRFYLKSPAELHDDPEDDDRSAITLWVPWTRAKGHDFGVVEDLFHNLNDALTDAIDQAYAKGDKIVRP